MTKATVNVVGKQIFINGQEVEIQKDSLFISGADDLDQPVVVHVALVVEDLTIQRKAELVEGTEGAVSNKVTEIITKTGPDGTVTEIKATDPKLEDKE